MVVEYPTQLAKTIDIYIGLIISLVIIVSYTWAVKQNYRIQYLKVKKFTEKGKIQFGCFEKDNGITFFVKDTGIGIKEEHLSKVFTLFNKVSYGNDEKYLYSGTGIGLSLSKELV